MKDQTDQMLEAIARSWAAVLPATPFDPDLSWSEAGVDSLKSLMFLLRLEAETGRAISFDLLGAQMSARDLAQALTAAGPNPEPRAAVHAILVPGVFGDEPVLADFRRAMAPNVSFSTLRPPGLEAPTRVLCDVGETARLMSVDVGDESDGVVLIGFSFGGLVVLELARMLEHRGRAVRLVCLLDPLLTFKGAVAGAADGAGVARARARTREWLSTRPGERLGDRLSRIAFHLLMRLGIVAAGRRLALRLAPQENLEQARDRAVVVIGTCRARAVARWRRPIYTGPTLLFASEQMALHHPVEAWRAICPDVRIVHAPGLHAGMFAPAGLAVIRPALLQALGLA